MAELSKLGAILKRQYTNLGLAKFKPFVRGCHAVVEAVVVGMLYRQSSAEIESRAMLAR